MTKTLTASDGGLLLFVFCMVNAINIDRTNKSVASSMKQKQVYPAYSAVKLTSGPYTGTGVFIGENMVLTAAHVVSSDNQVTVTTEGGKDYPGVVLWSETESDIALVEVHDLDLTPSVVSCRTPALREFVEIVGNPVGVGFVHTYGQVSRLPKSNGVSTVGKNYLFIEAPIAPGNGGGPVFDMEGSIVGIVSAVLIAPLAVNPLTGEVDRGLVGIGLAVPGEEICGLLKKHFQ